MQLKSRLMAMATIFATLGTSFVPTVQAAATGAFSAGDLIKGESFSSVYYYAPNGKRYVFPNEKTYFTW